MFALFKNNEGIYQVCNKSFFNGNDTSKNDLSVNEERGVLLAYNDDKATLDQLCRNLNSQSPRVDICHESTHKSDVRCNKGLRIISDQFIHPKKIIFRRKSEKDNNLSHQETMDTSGSVYHPSENDDTVESEVDKQQNSINNSNTSFEDTNDLFSSINEKSLTEPAKGKEPFNVPGNSAVDDQDVIIDLAEGTKKNFCLFCRSYQSQIARHLIQKHSNEKEVAEFKILPPKSLERKKLIAQIRKDGNFLLIDKNSNTGKLIPTRRPANSTKCSGKYFVYCPECRGLYSKNNIRHHYTDCANGAKSSKGILQIARAEIGRTHPRASLRMRRQVLPRMQEDDVVRVMRYDLLLVLYGNDLCLRHRREYRDKMIRQYLRQCGKFLLFLKEKNSKITDFASIYDTLNYHFIIEGIDTFIGVNEDTGHYNTASGATSLTRHIKEIGKIYTNECIINKDCEKEKEIKKFLHLCEKGFSTVTNKTAMETLVAQQRQKEVILPLSSDIQCLNKYLDSLIDEYYSALISKFSVDMWQKLAEVLLTRVQVFNRRRPGDIERLELVDMKYVQSIEEDDEDYKTLSREDRTIAREYVRIAMRGKLNQNVPVLLTKKWLDIMSLIIKYRKRAGVKANNIYVFGIPGLDNQGVLNATALLRKFSDKCDAKNPKALRATLLRKHAATTCARFGIDENSTVNFAKFMGHDLKIHKNIYRQSVAKTDILGISQVLEKASKPKENDSLNDTNQTLLSQSDKDLPNMSIDSTMDSSIENNKSIHKLSKIHTKRKTKLNNTRHYGSEKKNIAPKARWTREEIRSVKTHFADNFKTGKLPSLPHIRDIQWKHCILENRQPQVIKAWINNQIVQKKKKN